MWYQPTNHMAPHLRKPQSSRSPSWEPQISQNVEWPIIWRNITTHKFRVSELDCCSHLNCFYGHHFSAAVGMKPKGPYNVATEACCSCQFSNIKDCQMLLDETNDRRHHNDTTIISLQDREFRSKRSNTLGLTHLAEIKTIVVRLTSRSIRHVRRVNATVTHTSNTTPTTAFTVFMFMPPAKLPL